MKNTKSTKINLKLTNSDFPFNKTFKTESSAKSWFTSEFGSDYFKTTSVNYKLKNNNYSNPITGSISEIWDLLKTHHTLRVSDQNSWESFLTLKIS